MSKQLNREEAWALLTEYNQDPFHLHHARTVEGVMRYFAQELGYGDEVDFWGIVGLLHDLDFERYPDQHCIQSQEIQPEHEMEKVLFATDELTGLIGAAALMRPSKSVQDMELKSLKKKYKSSGFAAGCSREVIQRGADMLGWSLDELLTRTLDAMRVVEPLVAEQEAKEAK